MAGFLDQYGAGDERRAKRIKLIILSVAVGLSLYGLIYYFFHNFRQDQQVKQFFQLLAAHNYTAAYNLWNGSDTSSHDYPMTAFLQDWGPPVDVSGFSVIDDESCGKSVIVDVDAGKAGNKKVWVSRDTLGLSFPPNDHGCVQALIDGSGNLSYVDKHNKIYAWFRDLRYKLRGRTYRR